MPPLRSPFDLAARVLAIAYAAFLVVWLAVQPLPPLQDYMAWAYQGWLGAALLHGSPALAARFAVVHYPVPNVLSQAALIALDLGMGAALAAKLWIGALITVFAAACLWGARALPAGQRGAAALLLFLCFAVNSAFWDGYSNYQFSILVFLCAVLLRDRLTVWTTGLAGLLLFSCHASTFFAFVVFVAADAALDRKRRARLVGLAPALLLLAWYTLARRTPSVGQGDAAPLYGGLVHHLAYKAYTLSKIGPFHNLVDHANRSFRDRSPLLYRAGVGLNVLFALGFAGLLATAFARGKKAFADPLLLTASVLLTLFLLAPNKSVGVVNPGERLLYPALLLCFLSLRALPLGSLLAAGGAAGALLTAAQLLTFSTAGVNTPSVVPLSGRMAYADRYGLYDSRLYEFDVYRVFLRDPRAGQAPALGFDTSLLVDR